MRVFATLFVVCAAALATASPAQETQPGETALEGIDRSLKQIVELLKIQVGNQRAELAVGRLEIARRELVSRERELHEAEATRDQMARQLVEIEAQAESWRGRPPEDSQMSEENFRLMREQLERSTKSVKQELWRTDQRILDLRQAIDQVREELDTWEALVADSFDLLD